MTTRVTTLRAMHDLGLAAWFGGSLFGVAGLNAAADEAGDRRTTDRISSVGWAKWSPVATLALAAHAVGGAGLLAENRKRALAQKGATGTATAKLVVTGAAVAATLYTRLLGKKIEDAVVHASSGASSSATSPLDSSTTREGGDTGVGEAARQADKAAGQATSAAAESLPVDVEQARRQLNALQYAVPVLTGIVIVLAAQAGEQQRPGDQLLGLARRAGSAVTNVVS